MNRRDFLVRGMLLAVAVAFGFNVRKFIGVSVKSSTPTRQTDLTDAGEPDAACQLEGCDVKTVVVYESLYGNTAAIAKAIAEGIGSSARALSTAEATAEVVAEADLLIVGAPVHGMGLPTTKSREQARTENLGPQGMTPDLSHQMIRTWLSELRKGQGKAAAFQTRVNAWYGRGAAPKILSGLQEAGYNPIAEPHNFNVTGHPIWPTSDGVLCDGEIEKARLWGAELVKTMA